MAKDKTLHDAIAAKVKAWDRPASYRRSVHSMGAQANIRTWQKFPPLKPPRRPLHAMPGAFAADDFILALRWKPLAWWRFKRACYARGRFANDVIRELANLYTEDYEKETNHA
jgi:hypothetical protein